MGRRATRRARRSERRLEKTRSWKRCSFGSSKRRPRRRSLESGVMLLRLNQELLPEPGRPIDRTTTPLYFLGMSLATAAGRATLRGADSGPFVASEAVGSDMELGRKGACAMASIET